MIVTIREMVEESLNLVEISHFFKGVEFSRMIVRFLYLNFIEYRIGI